MEKKSIELVKSKQFDSEGPLYRVTKLTNTVEPTVGDHLSARDIQVYFRRPGWTVTIKEGKA